MKSHLGNYDEPWAGPKATAACGKVLKIAVALVIWDQDGADFDAVADRMIGLCRNCRRMDLEKRYVYVLASGQEARDEFSE